MAVLLFLPPCAAQSCRYKLRFIKETLNIIDFIAIIPFYIGLLADDDNAGSFSVLRIVKIVRVFRIFKATRHSTGLQILGKAL